MPWNYRVVKQVHKSKLTGHQETLYQIHEAFYDKKSSKKPYSITKEPTTFVASNRKGLKEILTWVQKALEKDVLLWEDFCKPKKKKGRVAQVARAQDS